MRINQSAGTRKCDFFLKNYLNMRHIDQLGKIADKFSYRGRPKKEVTSMAMCTKCDISLILHFLFRLMFRVITIIDPL